MLQGNPLRLAPGHLTRNSCLVLPLCVVVLVFRTSVASWKRAACPRVVALLGNVRGNVADSLNFLRNPTNLNHPTRLGNKPRAGRRSQPSIQGREVGAAQAPARTHREPALATSPCTNARKECKRASRGKFNQERRPR